jgi:tRNA pseudouridine38/39 synthase
LQPCLRDAAPQVRCIAAVLLMVGRGQEAPGVVSRLLDVAAAPCKPQYNIADEAPLLLYACEFEGLAWVRRRRAFSHAVGDVKRQMERHLVAAAMCGEILRALGPDLEAAGGPAAAAAEEGEREVGGRGRKARRAGGHVPLLSAARAKEVPLEERFRRLGIPVELLNRPGPAGFADGE